jgi:aryl-alcohol dehydrogenase-like predicted oxidoreductase
MYAGGESEIILGKALGAKRSEIALCTKAGFRASPSQLRTGLSARNLLAQAEGSLKRLGTDWLDLFVVHRVDPHTPLDETLRALEDLVRSGKVRYVGYSNWPAWQAALAVATQKERGWTRFRVGQMYASLGKYTRQDPTGGAGRLKDFDFLPTDKEKGWDLIDAMGKIAKARGVSVAAVALAWLLAKDWATTVLVGASKLSQLDDNLKAADLVLSKDEVAALDAVTAPTPMYPNWFNEKTADAATRQALGV